MTQLKNKETEDIQEAFSRHSLFYKRGIAEILELASNALAETNKTIQDRIDKMSMNVEYTETNLSMDSN